MSADHYYNMCCNAIGKPVRVECAGGKVHYGYIDRVDRTHLYLRPMDGPQGGGGGYGGPGTFLWGFGAGAVFGIALGTIVGLSFSPFLWW